MTVDNMIYVRSSYHCISPCLIKEKTISSIQVLTLNGLVEQCWGCWSCFLGQSQCREFLINIIIIIIDMKMVMMITISIHLIRRILFVADFILVMRSLFHLHVMDESRPIIIQINHFLLRMSISSLFSENISHRVKLSRRPNIFRFQQFFHIHLLQSLHYGLSYNLIHLISIKLE